MPSIITHKIRQFNADQFYESLSEAIPSNLYMYIGKSRAWVDDAVPPNPVNAVANTEYGFWRDMMSAKKITASDASYVIPRENWTTGTLYPQYKDTTADLLSLSPHHYVMTDDYNVYKCLFNNGGINSTDKPTGTSVNVIETSDGYKWKYMFTVSAADALKFITTNYIPVKIDATVSTAAVNGSIDIIEVDVVGSAIPNKHHTGTLSVGGTTTVTLDGGASTTTDEYTGNVLYITSGTGQGEHSEITGYTSGRVATVSPAFATTLDTSSVFSIAPKVEISGDGTGATAVSTVDGSDFVDGIIVTNVGSNYTYATVVISGPGVSGTTANAYIPPPGGHGNNAITELGGHNVTVNTQFDKAEGGKFTVSNDFRTIGLLRDPVLSSDGTTAATAAAYDQTTTLTYSGLSGTFEVDEIITGATSNATAYVIDDDGSDLKVSEITGTFGDESITGGTSGATASVTIVGTTVGELQPYVGDLMYIDQRSPISRSTDQIEDVKLTINF